MIGIPTYNSENNIVKLLESLTSQQQKGYKLSRIIVYSDGSTDDTTKLSIKKFKNNKKITIVESQVRRGFAHGVKYLAKLCREDVFVLLNDDIRIDDKHIVSKLVQPYIRSDQYGLVSGNPVPLPAHTFVQSAGLCTYRAYSRMRYSIRKGNNRWTCDGKILALSREFINKIKLYDSTDELGNVDSYLYFSCISYGFVYKHIRSAVVRYLFPSTLKDYISWTTRNNSQKHILQTRFKEIIEKEYSLPKGIYLKEMVNEFIHEPIKSLFIYSIGVICKFRSRYMTNRQEKWNVIVSTKEKLYSSI